MSDLAAWATTVYPGGSDSGRQTIRCVGDSTSEGFHTTVDGHIQHVRTSCRYDGAANLVEAEKTVEWTMSDDYWLAHATPAAGDAVEKPQGEQPCS